MKRKDALKRKPAFATTLVPDMWADAGALLARAPKAVDLRTIATIDELVAVLKSHRANGALRILLRAADRYYLPLFFEVARAAAARPKCTLRMAHDEPPFTEAEWEALFFVPWEPRGE